ncbi:MAG: DNA-processing protein DprA [Peptococcaceae bacterium]|nr:DNA-processing protein DprA [Peptococcaceae bacterium]
MQPPQASEKIAAVIGTRRPGQNQARACRIFCGLLLQAGYLIHTGGAVGIDEIAMSCAGERSVVFLPWAGYDEHLVRKYRPGKVVVYDPLAHKDWTDSVFRYHPAPDRLTRGGIALHARNFGIVGPAQVVVALPSPNLGGTGQGIRIARATGKKIIVHKEADNLENNLRLLRNFI